MQVGRRAVTMAATALLLAAWAIPTTAAAASSTYATSVTVRIAKPSVITQLPPPPPGYPGPWEGTFTNTLMATSVGSTVAWDVSLVNINSSAPYNHGIYFGRFAGGNTFRHNFPAPYSPSSGPEYVATPIDSFGRTGVGSNTQDGDHEIYDDSAFTGYQGTWSTICNSAQDYGGCEHHSSGTALSLTQAHYQLPTNADTGVAAAYAIGIVGSTGPQGGIANVYVNSIYRGQMSFYRPTVTHRNVLFAYGVVPDSHAGVFPTLTSVDIVLVGHGPGGGFSLNLDAMVEDSCCGD